MSQPIASISSIHDLLSFAKSRLDDMEGDANIQGTAARRVGPLLAALPPNVALSAKTIAGLDLDAHETVYLLLETWRRLGGKGAPKEQPNAPLAKVLEDAYKHFATGEPFGLQTDRVFVAHDHASTGTSVPFGVFDLTLLPPMQRAKLPDNESPHHVSLELSAETAASMYSDGAVAPLLSGKGTAQVIFHFLAPDWALATKNWYDAPTRGEKSALVQLDQLPTRALVELRRHLDESEGRAREVVTAIEAVLDQRAAPVMATVTKALEDFHNGSLSSLVGTLPPAGLELAAAQLAGKTS
jgi:hypothetical protein